MVSIRCKMMVKEELKKLGIHYIAVDWGEVEIMENITMKQRQQIKTAFHKSGLELMDDKKAILIEKIKNAVIEMIHHTVELPRINISNYLSEKLKYDYTYLSNLFSQTQGITIEHYIITHKIEKVKELILYDELNLTEIAFKLQYSSVSHLSRQFRKTTGLTPSFFKSLKNKKRSTLEDL